MNFETTRPQELHPGDRLGFNVQEGRSHRLVVRTACGAEIELRLPPGASLRLAAGSADLVVMHKVSGRPAVRLV